MSKIDFINAFYDREHDAESLISGLDSLLHSKELGAFAIPFYSQQSPSVLMANFLSRRRHVIQLKSSKTCQLYRLTYRMNLAGEPVRREGRFFVAMHPKYRGIYVAVTLESNDFVQHGLSPILKSLHPHFVRPFVSQDRLRKMLDDFKAKNGFTELIITRASQVLRFNEEGVHRRSMPVVSWPGMSVEEGFRWTYQHDGWFQSLQFEPRDRLGHIKAIISITRNGMLRADRLFALAFETFVHSICKSHYESMELFSKRGRNENRQLATKPLVIDFGEPQFDTVSENAKFIQAMKRMKTASVSVLHGNPYINMTITDYLDGSIFDVWVLNKEKMIIVPQMKGTIGAIKRLVNHIFDTYAEGDIVDYAAGAL